jgi:hypothetical protein
MCDEAGKRSGERRESARRMERKQRERGRRMLKSEKKKTGNNEEDGSIKRDFHG